MTWSLTSSSTGSSGDRPMLTIDPGPSAASALSDMTVRPNRNRAPVEQDYPAFELTLTNSQEQTISRRVFLPAEYLQWTEAADGLKAGSELPIRLFLDTGELRAAGYRVYLFYP